jgi:glycopeptide antibiotics resistance protein
MAFLFTFLIALLTSSSIEFLQILIPTRTSQVIDIVLNVTGACIGAFSVLFSKWFYRLKKGSEEILTPGP